MFEPEIYRMILFVYVSLLIPAAVGMVLFGRWVDGLLGWDFLPGAPWNWIGFAVLLGAGLALVWWCYSYIVVVGRGGPAPLVAPGANRLVLGGPYGLTRHPSVVGKLLGVIGLALLLRSCFFLVVMLPPVLTLSLLEKYFMMERRDIEHFGPRYAQYVRRVPFFIPRPADVVRLMRTGMAHERDVVVIELPAGSDD
jgi:protein-S-isoprenylcysteine O-methyltransferase Ste14